MKNPWFEVIKHELPLSEELVDMRDAMRRLVERYNTIPVLTEHLVGLIGRRNREMAERYATLLLSNHHGHINEKNVKKGVPEAPPS